ncbi:MAG: hypothetical protein ACYTKD_18870 [Planctomycetota bacterium]|jgi:hypothetical protein
MAENSHGSGRPAEREAVYTTIVGGRPPGCGTEVGDVPRGIEVLVKKAAVDAEFKALFLRERAEAAKAIALDLDPAEAAMLGAIPAAQLEAIIASTKVDEKARPALLGKAAVVMIAALGAVAPACEPVARSPGTRPSVPPPRPQQVEPATATDDVPDAKSDAKPDADRITRGIRPDRP